MSLRPNDHVPFARRVMVLGAVLILLALAGVANATIKRHRTAAGARPDVSVSFVHSTAGFASSAWYSAGPLPLGLKKESSSIAVANVSAQSVGGELLVSTSSGLSFIQPITVAASSTMTLPLPKPAHSSFGAASVLVDGSGIGVEEVIHGPTGEQASPCVSQTATAQYLAGGSTLGSADIALSLYDPGATPSVANISFATSSGAEAPAPYQGLPIAAGQVVVVDVGRVVPQRDVVATMVQASGGRLVVGAIESGVVGKVLDPSLLAAQAVPQSKWYLPGQVAGGSSHAALFALNPGSQPTTATIQFSGSAGGGIAAVPVAAGAVARLNPNPVASDQAIRSMVVTSPGSPLVVMAENLLPVPLGTAPPRPHVAKAPPAKKGAPPAKSATTTTVAPQRIAARGVIPVVTPAADLVLPAPLPLGSALTPGTVPSGEWLLLGGQSDQAIGEYVTIDNTSAVASNVTLETLGGGQTSVIPGLADVVIAPGATVVVNLAAALPVSHSLTIVAVASAPVVVGADLYAKGSSSSFGLSDPVAIPVD